MIVKCANSDQHFIEEYIGNRYPECLYLYLDLKQYGVDSQYTSCWALKNNENIEAVILLYHTAMHLFSASGNFNVNEILEFVAVHKPSIICASKKTIEKISCVLTHSGYIVEFGHIGKLSKIEKKSNFIPLKAELEDIDDIARLLYQDDDIGASYSFDDLKTQIKERLEEKFVRSYVIKDDGQVVCHVGTGAEIPSVCTIAYGITDMRYRGKGLFSSLLAFACEELTNERKEIFSVYYPENSRILHHKIGFVDYCECGKLFKNID